MSDGRGSRDEDGKLSGRDLGELIADWSDSRTLATDLLSVHFIRTDQCRASGVITCQR